MILLFADKPDAGSMLFADAPFVLLQLVCFQRADCLAFESKISVCKKVCGIDQQKLKPPYFCPACKVLLFAIP